LINSVLVEYRGGEFGHWEKKQLDNVMRSIDRIFMFSLSFSIGANYDLEDRNKFNERLFEFIEVFNENPNQ